jgi:hypothetical protein
MYSADFIFETNMRFLYAKIITIRVYIYMLMYMIPEKIVALMNLLTSL